MKKVKFIILFFVLALASGLKAQSDVDALRYSMTFFGGTARSSGMAGAFGAIGADFSVISTNPAGLGVFRQNEFTFTPSIYTGRTSATYNGNENDDMKYNFNISNVGMVWALKKARKNDQSEWKAVNFAIGLNRNSNFNNRIIIYGYNSSNSLMDVYRNAAQGTTTDNLGPFDTQLAYQTQLLTNTGSTNYLSNVPNGGVMQRKLIETTGSMQEMVFALGANYENKFFIGGTVGVPFIRYNELSNYTESDTNQTSNFKAFNLNNNLTTTGTGINFKFGMIYVPVDVDAFKVRIGAAVHTPSFYSMHDNWIADMTSSFDNGTNYEASSPIGNFDYQLITPMQLLGSLAVQIGGCCTLSADYEFVDYSETRFRSQTYDYFQTNEAIQENYTTANNLRFGGEVALGMFSIRAGYAVYGSPYKAGINDGQVTAITGGIGIMDKNYFLDFAYIYSSSNENYYLYNWQYMNAASLDKSSNNFLITLGYKF